MPQKRNELVDGAEYGNVVDGFSDEVRIVVYKSGGFPEDFFPVDFRGDHLSGKACADDVDIFTAVIHSGFPPKHQRQDRSKKFLLQNRAIFSPGAYACPLLR